MQSLSVQLWPFFEWLLWTTLQAALLVLVILIVQALLRHRLGARLHYCLWLLLLIRLSLPWAPQSRISLAGLLHMVLAGGPMASTPVEGVLTGPQPTPYPKVADTLIAVLPVIWLAGVLALSVCVAITGVVFWRRVRRGAAITDQETIGLLDRCKSQMQVRTTPQLLVTDAVGNPTLFGFVRPRLLLPPGMAESLSPEQLRHVFLHELAHLKHLDIIASHIAGLMLIIHWFNPLLWLGFYRMRADRELACDELVLSIAADDEPQKYGRTIISLVERFNRATYFPAAVGIMENKSQLKRRITMIAQFRKLSKKWSILAVLVLALVAGVALTNATAPSTAVSENQVAPGGEHYNGPLAYVGYAEPSADNEEQAPMMYGASAAPGNSEYAKGFAAYGARSEDSPKGFGGFGGNPESAESDDKQAPMMYGAYAEGEDAPKGFGGFGGSQAYFGASRADAAENDANTPDAMP